LHVTSICCITVPGKLSAGVQGYCFKARFVAQECADNDMKPCALAHATFVQYVG